MNSVPPAAKSLSSAGSEPIPGYVLQDRLGNGGYGEVWKALAPGGLFKAVKIVYGTMDEVRAARELKSLNRIKAVNHPFLLSLERIEVVDGHLLIVMELAEASLKQRFDACREQGLDGVPREELLAFLRDAAEALDFLYEQHSLQHLDVKPENLLLVGRHIKVGDFGMLKSLDDPTHSQLGGMTPLYSAPEVFDGHPSPYSDQYSLAIVYQEMLTGQPPFEGRTSAQLAAQHLRSQPTLTSLPMADRHVIARALSKDPKKRYANSQAFLDALGRTGTKATTSPRSAPRVAPAEGLEKTQPLPSTLRDEDHRTMVLASTTNVESLPPIELSRQPLKYRPTIVVGLGGTGKAILRRLGRRIAERFGDVVNCPVQLLALDTHADDSPPEAPGTEVPFIAMPLRTAKEYRDDAEKLLETISRRWIYNIPRSLRTEGLRPLGRLAFVDHARKVMERLRTLIVRATSTEARAAVAAAGWTFDPAPPQVWIAASISGGTGSGAVLDLAYAVRKSLGDSGVADDNVIGLLTHATTRKSGQRDLALANAYACLSELLHYSTPGQRYPGDAAAGLPPRFEDQMPFRDTYLLQLGELNDEEFVEATEMAAEYVFQNTLTPAAEFFEIARRMERESSGPPLERRQVRTFGLSRFRVSEDVSASEVDQLGRALVERWRSVVDPSLGTLLGGWMKENGLTANALIDRVYQTLQRARGRDLESDVRHLAHQFAGQTRRAAVAAIDATFVGGTDAPTEASLGTTIVQQLKDAYRQLGRKLHQWVLGLLDDPGRRLATANAVAQQMGESLAAIERQLNDVLRRLDQQLVELASPSPVEHTPAEAEWLQTYTELRLHHTVHACLRTLLGDLRTPVDRLQATLREFDAELARVVETLTAAATERSRVREFFITELDGRVPQLQSQLVRAVSGDAFARTELVSELRSGSRAVISGKSSSDTNRKTSVPASREPNSIDEWVSRATPRLIGCGGACRWLAVVPNGQDSGETRLKLSAAMQTPATWLTGNDARAIVCLEVEQVSLDNVAGAWTRGMSEPVELAGRLHTRSDVAWLPLSV